MSFAFFYDVPGNPRIYEAVKAEIGPDVPVGLVAQIVLQVERGLRHIMVWNTREDWELFSNTRVEPALERALAAAGISAQREAPVITMLDLVDAWAPGPRQHTQP